MNVLIIEDDEAIALVISEIVKISLPSDIHIVNTCQLAALKVTWADLIISDFDFPIHGFLGILPLIRNAACPYILHSASPDYLKMYDPLQIATLDKGDTMFVHNLIRTLQNMN